MNFLASFGNWCGGPGLWHGGSGMGSWMPFHFGGIIPLLIIGLLTFMVIRMVRKPEATASGPSTSDILKRRYASGEIDKVTYDRLRDELK